MIKWAVKLTPIAGVIELGVMEPFDLPTDKAGYLAPHFTTIPEIEEYILDNGLHCYDRNHMWNPQLANRYEPMRNPDEYGPNHWHTDTQDGHSVGPDFIMMIASPDPACGTLFSGPIDKRPYMTRFRAIPWHVYLVHGDIMHHAPDDANVPRICYRWYQSDKHIDDNSRRDEDGVFVFGDIQ